MDEGDDNLTPCKCCGRNFRIDVLTKHEPICIKSSKKQRKVFDSGKQRAQGSDIPINKTIKPGEVPKADPKVAQAEAKTKQWRQKHEMLVNSFRAARNYARAKSTGAPLPPPPPPVIDSSLVQCPYCQRRFNEDACNRHVPFCKEQQAKLGNKNVASKKPLYKAPPLKAKQPIPVQKSGIVTPNGYGSQPQSSVSSQTTSTRTTTSSNLPVKSAKSNLPTKTVIGRPQASPTTGDNHQSSIPSGNTRPGSYNVPAARGAVRATAPATTITKTNVRKPPSVGINANNKSLGFCHECGAPFSVATARFCSECGVRKLAI